MFARTLGKLLLTLYAIIILLPLLVVVMATMKDQQQFYMNPIGVPSSFSLDNYIHLFQSQPMLMYFSNSVIVSFSTVAVLLVLASMISFGLYRLKNKISQTILLLFVIGLMVPSQVNMIPIHSFLRDLGLTNSRIGLILVSVSVLMPLSVFMINGFMKSLPREVFESASIDGAGESRMYLQIAMPLSVPYLAATATFLFVSVWNELLFPLLLITDQSKMTLPLALLQFQGEYSTNYPGLLSGVVIISLPMLVMFLFLQRFFISGVTAGSLKG
ncbi:carbohydrate ABC transporter permease [Paenibacillus urinalis]|uniref:Carbohydrate ABC transporter permease n=1 Tax=Paenibacillus urinalis TaxID=521520 RepID=A0AAX3N2T5_9BACL|nr:MULTISPECIES: carbohydrate ABC transporter permease [Paenibacillus]OMC72054.1 ABC transporter permease [Paenibacillus sp. FSL H7-0326]WDH83671.1 carbohydrate ABC transporter permease [Paenibacillus urinalis]SDX34206.1 carbohydrate ABC transporter membrane protein 2, CUT1 family [Paenibacillus sp. PDC88]